MKNNKGFSLVELIIVIAIMAILAGALAPALIKYIKKSRRSTDISNADTIKTAVTTALATESGYDAASASTTYNVPTGSSANCFENEVWEALNQKEYKPKYVSGSFTICLDANKNVAIYASGIQVTPSADGIYAD